MIPVFNLTRQYESIKAEIDYAVGKVLSKGYFTLGSEVAAFEQDFAAYLNIGHAVGVGSGTDALTLVLKASGIGAGDEVILPANAYPSAFGVALAGVRIRLVDVSEDGCMDPRQVADAITKKTKAIIPVHLYGNPADIENIYKSINYPQRHCEESQKDMTTKQSPDHNGIASPAARNDNLFHVNLYKSGDIKKELKNKIFVIEDCAQAHGARIGGKKAGTLGDAAIFSFYPSKNLGAYGDGGMIVTDSPKLAGKIRMLRQYGEKKRYESEVVSGVSRLDELQASILRVKLRYLDGWNKRRQEIAEYYFRELDGIGDLRFSLKLKVQSEKLKITNQNESVHHLFVIGTRKRDALKTYLEKQGIGTGVHYPVPVHLTKSFKNLGYKKGDFPESEKQAKEVLSLPMYPELTDREVETVVGKVKMFFRTS